MVRDRECELILLDLVVRDRECELILLNLVVRNRECELILLDLVVRDRECELILLDSGEGRLVSGGQGERAHIGGASPETATLTIKLNDLAKVEDHDS